MRKLHSGKKKLDFIIHIRIIKSSYPFLIDTWNLYEEFDKPVVDEETILYYDYICQVVLGMTDRKNEKYKNVCKKLMNNLDVYHSATRMKPISPSSKRCKTMNYWLYHVINKVKIPAELINKIFKKSNDIVFSDPDKHICFNTYDEKIIDPLKIIKLYNLQENIEIFLSTLKQKGSDNYCFCKKYIYECVDIYKDMNRLYCTNTDYRNNKYKSTCDILSSFNSSYMEYLYRKLDADEKIPSLLSEENEPFEKCLSAQDSIRVSTIEHANSNSSTTGGVSTAFGTIAGATSILALIYKVNTRIILNV
ncbi:hypothetical protein PCYB_006610 [Plasmodium cynomolgi strain B]|uniref:CYIR protein n=1 Tax=Plasmodium cynomolgi (strain B) TaxID=1120755 RepID=K6VKE3_PLACD|nr:hypothetical protein PCYB_006610 [Plasmodium cynomolgi strain B]GAB69912.1 hypothetical protein PCYB_006610 [Plasmodium cynomolgi strain B]